MYKMICRSFVPCIFILSLATGCDPGRRPNAPKRENASSSAEAATQAIQAAGSSASVDGAGENTPARSLSDPEAAADKKAAYLVEVQAKIVSLCKDPALNRLNGIIHITQQDITQKITKLEDLTNKLLKEINTEMNKPIRSTNSIQRLKNMTQKRQKEINRVQRTIDQVRPDGLYGSAVVGPQWLQQQREKLQEGLQEISTARDQLKQDQQLYLAEAGATEGTIDLSSLVADLNGQAAGRDINDLESCRTETLLDISYLAPQMQELLEAMEQRDIEAEALQISMLETRTKNLQQQIEQAQSEINEVASLVQPAGSSSG